MLTEIHAALSDGSADYRFEPVFVTWQGYRLQCLTLADSIRINGTRVALSAFDLQRVADWLDCVLPTPKLLDCRYHQSRRDGVVIEPVFRHGGRVAALLAAAEYSALVDARIADVAARDNRMTDGLVGGAGKTWVICAHLAEQSRHGIASAYNYGWFTRADPNCTWTSPTATPLGRVTVAQAVASPWSNYLHNDEHVDPSQGTFGLFAQEALLTHPDQTQELVRLENLLTCPYMAPMVSHEGSLAVTRQPRVERAQPLGA